MTPAIGFPPQDEPLNGYATAFNQQQHVNFVGEDGLIHELLMTVPGSTTFSRAPIRMPRKARHLPGQEAG